MPKENFYTMAETAKKVGVSGSTISNWVKRGYVIPRISTHGFRPKHFFGDKEIRHMKERLKGGTMAWF